VCVIYEEQGVLHVREPLQSRVYDHEIGRGFFDNVIKLTSEQIIRRLKKITFQRQKLEIEQMLLQEGLRGLAQSSQQPTPNRNEARDDYIPTGPSAGSVQNNWPLSLEQRDEEDD